MSSRIVDASKARSEPMLWRKVALPAPIGRPAPDPASAPSPDARDENLEREISRRVEEAHRRGFNEGEARGRQVANQQLLPVLERLARSCEEIGGLAARVRREAEADLVRLAVAIARRILRRELTVDPEAILGVAKAALSRVDARDLKRVRAHPEAAAWLKQRLEHAGLPSRIEVAADSSLEPGAVLFETTRGLLDASVETQLGEIERGFADLLGPPA